MGTTTAMTRRRRDDGPQEPPVVAGRVPPNDRDAEAAVLSACLLSGDALDRVSVVLEPDHFYSDANRLIFDACRKLVLDGVAVDVVSVAAWLRSREQIQRVGGTAYLGQLVDATPAPGNVLHHAEVVVEKWRLRRAIATCQKHAAEGYGDVGDPTEWLDGLEQEVFEVNHHARPNEAEPIQQILVKSFQKISAAAEAGGVMGIPTKYVDLDKKTGGLHGGDLVIVAGRPGMGKSSYVFNVAINVASPTEVQTQDDAWGAVETTMAAGRGVAIFSLEMPKEQVATRMLCSEARVDVGKLRQGLLSQEDWNSMTGVSSFLGSLPIYIDDTADLTVMMLRGKIRPIARNFERAGTPLGLVVIDYLQLMAHHDKRVASREQEISTITRLLKQLAKELGVPIIALSQLNRGVETRGGKDKRPMLSDLRESGAIEQDADCIIFVYRDEYYNRETTEARGIAEMIIAKQRNGPTGTVRLRFVGYCTKFENLAAGEYEEFEEL